MPRFFCFYLLPVVVVSSLGAQNSILTLKQAEALYLAQNPMLEAGKDSIEAAEARHIQAGLRPNPELNFSQEGVSSGPENASVFNDQEFILWATQRFELGGKRRHRREVSETGIEITRAEFEDSIRQGRARVREAYLVSVFAQEKATLAGQQLESFHRVKEIHQQRFAAGDVSGLAQMRVDLEELRYLSALNQATTDANSYWSDLAALIGWTGSERASLKWERQNLDLTASLAQLQKQALESRPDLRTMSLERERHLREVGFEKAQRIPDVTVGGGYKRDFGESSYYAAIHIPLPLFDRNQGAIQEASAALRRAENQFHWKKLRIRSEVEQSYRNCKEQQAIVARIERDVVQRAALLQSTAWKSYQEGESDLTDYLDALRVRLDVALSFYDLLLQFERSRIQLAQAVGVEIK